MRWYTVASVWVRPISIQVKVSMVCGCGWWLCNPEYDTGDGAAMQIEMISAYGQLEVEDKENGKNNAVRPAMWVTWQSDMQVIEE